MSISFSLFVCVEINKANVLILFSFIYKYLHRVVYISVPGFVS